MPEYNEPSIFPVCDCLDAQFLLQLDDVSNGLVFGSLKLKQRTFIELELFTLLKQSHRTKKRAYVFGTKRGVAARAVRRHIE